MNYGNTHYAKAPNIQFFVLLPFLVQWGVQMKIEIRCTARLKALNSRVLYLQHNFRRVRISVENDVLNLSDMLDSERTETLGNPFSLLPTTVVMPFLPYMGIHNDSPLC